MSNRILTLALASICLSSMGAQWVHADAKEFYFRRYEARRHSRNWLAADSTGTATPAAAPDQWFDQKLDHGNDQDMRTFKQRYWVISDYAKSPDAPVLYYICGEASCSASEIQNATAANAQKLGAYAIGLEHRYYGKSQPFNSLTTENMKYLTVANALADLAGFERFAKRKLGFTGKWVSVGGSYPGALSAYYRTQYPEMVEGALASSAPVKALENFEAYDRHVFEVAGPECATVMRQVVKATEDSLSDPTKLASIKQAFAADAIRDDVDFLYLIADVGASAVQYGMRDPFCQALTNAGADINSELTAYANFAQKIFELWGMTAVQFSVQSAEDLDPNSYLSGFGMRQWMYQSCTEFGFFQNAYHDPAYSVRSARINPQYHRALCKRLFGLDQPVDTAATNRSFYAPILSGASNLLLTNGSNDPWSILGITPLNGNDTNPGLTVLLIEGSAHCDDLNAPAPFDSAPLKDAKQKFTDLATLWLKP